MREDMWKVIVERPRFGHRFARHVGRRDPKVERGDVDGDDLPKMSRMKRRRDKSLNENLAPLKRYLRSQVGRPWDNIYSDIRAHIRFDNVVQKHVCAHIDNFVTFHARVEADGAVVDLSRNYLVGRWRILKVGAMYVCPRTGILRTVRPRKGPHAADCHGVIVVDERTHLRRIGGVWFSIEIAPFDTPVRPPATEPFDVVLGARLRNLTPRQLQRVHGRPGVFAIARYELRKRDLKDYRARGILPSR